MTPIEKLQTTLTNPGRLSRRSFLGRTVRWSAALAGAAAGVTAFAKPAYGANYVCCDLCWPNNICNSDYWDSQCPSGCGSPWEWTCRSGNCTWWCGECCPMSAWCTGAGCPTQCQCSYARFIPCSPGCACSPELEELASRLSIRTKEASDMYQMTGGRR